MNKREKILLIAVVCAVGLLLGKAMIGNIILGPINKTNEDIKSVKIKIKDKDKKLKRKASAIQQWQQLQQQCIAEDPQAAQRVFIKRIHSIIEASDLTVDSIQPVEIAKRKTAGHYLIAVRVSGSGMLQQITRFFELYYAEPYPTKVTGMMLKPYGKRGERLQLSNCRLESIVLADVEGSRGRPTAISADRQAQLDAEPELAGISNAYAQIHQKDIFHRTKPKPKSEPKVELKPEPAREPKPKPKPKPIASKPGDGDIVVTVAYGQKKGAYVRNSGAADLYKIGEQIRGKTLVFVHPLGVVFRQDDGTYVYTEIGKNVKAAQAFDQQAPMELYRAWQAEGQDSTAR